MTCDTCREALAAGDSGASRAADVEAHLVKCGACRVAQAEFAQIDAALGAAPAWTPPRHFAQRVAVRAVEEMQAASVSVYGVTPEAVHLVTSAVVLAIGAVVATRLLGSVVVPALMPYPAAAALSLLAVSVASSVWLQRRWVA